jgi:hypothetical protein
LDIIGIVLFLPTPSSYGVFSLAAVGEIIAARSCPSTLPLLLQRLADVFEEKGAQK